MSYKLARAIHRTAGKVETELIRIHSDPIRGLFECVNGLYNELNRMDSRDAYALKFRLWQLKSTILGALRPFDCPSLNLKTQLEEILSVGRDYSGFSERAGRLSEILTFLSENPENHKRNKIFEIIKGSDRNQSIGLITRITHGRNPAWSEVISDEIRNTFPETTMIPSPTRIESEMFDQIIVPGGMSDSKLKTLLHNGFRTSRIEVVAYTGEEVEFPPRPGLPGKDAGIDLERDGQIEDAVSTSDQWVYDGFWEYMRGENAKSGVRPTEATDRQFLVRARLVLLAPDQKVFLKDDAKVPEISDLIDGNVNLKEMGKHLPRRAVSNLKEGHLIVLRTSGSGNYLVEVADALLVAEDRADLREKALDWKELLRKTLSELGVTQIYIDLLKRDHFLSDRKYPWQWTTSDVMRPKSKQRFIDLILILHEHGYHLTDGNPVEAAELRWNQMQELQRYHHKAGNQIKRSLLRRLRKLVDENVQIDDKLILNLPGVDAGELSVFRIVDVDPDAIDVPYTRVGVVTPVEP